MLQYSMFEFHKKCTEKQTLCGAAVSHTRARSDILESVPKDDVIYVVWVKGRD